MPKNKELTLKRILESAEREFTKCGFDKASIRCIAENAGVTPGAIYKHFQSKEEIFERLVSPTVNTLYERNRELTQAAIGEIRTRGLSAFQNKADEANREVLQFTYDNFEKFNLLFNCSKGTRYENIREEWVALEVVGTKKLINRLKECGVPVNELADNELHILYTIVCTPLFEIITHKYSYEKALHFLDVMEEVMNIGWKRIIG